MSESAFLSSCNEGPAHMEKRALECRQGTVPRPAVARRRPESAGDDNWRVQLDVEIAKVRALKLLQAVDGEAAGRPAGGVVV